MTDAQEGGGMHQILTGACLKASTMIQAVPVMFPCLRMHSCTKWHTPLVGVKVRQGIR